MSDEEWDEYMANMKIPGLENNTASEKDATSEKDTASEKDAASKKDTALKKDTSDSEIRHKCLKCDKDHASKSQRDAYHKNSGY